MQGIISPLDDGHSKKIQELWQRLSECCGLKEVLRLPLPHLTWHVADQYDIPTITGPLANLAHAHPPLQISTNGLGIFTGLDPVLYMPVVRNKAADHLHSEIFQIVASSALAASALYSPEAWVPHITLAHSDAHLDALQCALSLLLSDPLNWMIPLHFVLLVEFEPGSHAHILQSFQLVGTV